MLLENTSIVSHRSNTDEAISFIFIILVATNMRLYFYEKKKKKRKKLEERLFFIPVPLFSVLAVVDLTILVSCDKKHQE